MVIDAVTALFGHPKGDSMRKWWPLIAVCAGSFLFLLDTTVVTVALPSIGAELSASVE
ncbi:hypothetical protein [Amycolatopsis sp. NPDC051371]|uniref:hypothetical protein n=1 Tax=Amycolatopsis sp. NPDC051371 TaxID=3155800 RepID=UPI0034174356